LSVEYPASEADYMPSLAQSFLQSFRAPERSPGEARQHGAAQQEDAPDEGGKEDTQ
jgi:hypothetical protein